MRRSIALVLASLAIACGSSSASNAPSDAGDSDVTLHGSDDAIVDATDANDAVAEASDAGATGVTVSGVELRRDGVRWDPKGLSMIGALTKGSAIEARKHFGAAEIAAAKSWGADTFRFQVSQPFLDPSDPQYDASYVDVVKSITNACLDAGFVVVLSMQDQSLAGGDATPTPTSSTVRAWNALAPAYAEDRRVIYELFNEPNTTADAAGWTTWTSGDATKDVVGHQALVDRLRALGAVNVLFADGAQHAEILPSTPLLTDALAAIVYAAHPYYLGPKGGERAQWDARFGNLSSIAPVVVSEWNDYSAGSCNLDAPTLVPQLLDYLHAHHVGLYGWAFDLPSTLVQDWSWTPTSFVAYACGTPGSGGGAGALIQAYFLE